VVPGVSISPSRCCGRSQKRIHGADFKALDADASRE
jgi:hypothetical protein